jgi:hypothetical protein
MGETQTLPGGSDCGQDGVTSQGPSVGFGRPYGAPQGAPERALRTPWETPEAVLDDPLRSPTEPMKAAHSGLWTSIPKSWLEIPNSAWRLAQGRSVSPSVRPPDDDLRLGPRQTRPLLHSEIP